MALGGQVAVGDVTIAYEVTGSPADPSLLLLHGITDNLRTYDDLAPKLAADGYRVFAIDHRGHGRSSHAPTYDLSDYAADAVTVIDELIGEAPVIVGHSLGGLVGLYVAARHPDHCRALFVEDPPIFAAEKIEGTVFEVYFTFLRDFLVDHRERGGTVDELIEMAGAMPLLTESQLAAYAEGLMTMDPALLTPPLEDRGLDDFVSDDDLPSIGQPVYLLSGVYDLGGAMRADEPARFLRLITQAGHTHVDDTGHMIHQQQPDRYLAALRSFLAGLPPRDPLA